MKVDLPALSLALSRASSGIKRTESPSSGAVLLRASQGLLRASMCDGQRLSSGICTCEGDLEVAVEAKRLAQLIQSCSAPELKLSHNPEGGLLFRGGGVKAKLNGYVVEDLPSHAPPPADSRIDLWSELSDRVRWANRLTEEKLDYNSKPIERVVLLELGGGKARVFARLQGTMAVWFEGSWDGEISLIPINRGLVSLFPPGPLSLAWSDGWIGFEGDSSTHEPRIECDEENGARYWKRVEACPSTGSQFSAKALQAAIDGALSVYSADTTSYRSVVLEAEGEVLRVISQSHAGEYVADVPLSGEAKFKGKFNAELVSRIASGFKDPFLAVKDSTLWMWHKNSKVALQGMRA